ncbi:MAG: hypothetical protein ABIS07_01980 [Dokdonella sp.]
MKSHTKFLLSLLLLPCFAGATDYGSVTIKDKKVALTSALAFVQRYDHIGKTDVVVLLAPGPIDASVLDWIDPVRGAARGPLLRGEETVIALKYTGADVIRLSVNAPGIGYEDLACSSECKSTAQRAGDGFKGSFSGLLRIGSHDDGPPDAAFNVHFDIPHMQAQDFGASLPTGGGDPGKAFVAYAKAFDNGDYEALKAVNAEAEKLWGDANDAAKRSHDIQAFGRGAPKNPTLLKGWQHGDSALLIVEGTPKNWSRKFRIGVGLTKAGGQWQVREQVLDLYGTTFVN